MKEISTPYTLIFDFDGTLADTTEAVVRSLNNLSEKYGFQKIEDIESFRNREAKQIFKESGISLRTLPRIAREVQEQLTASMEEVSFYAGMKDTIKTLNEQGHVLGILTSNTKENVERFLAIHNVREIQFVCAERKVFGKGRVIKSLMKKNGFQKDTTLYVGDETRDIEAAQKARVGSMAVTWGFDTEALLQTKNPDYLIRLPQEIVSIVQDA